MAMVLYRLYAHLIYPIGKSRSTRSIASQTKCTEKHRNRQDVREGDLLMVRDGTYLIGNCAYVSQYDTRIVYQSHLLKLRCTDHAILSPFLLLAMLSSEPVQRQIRDKRLTHDIIDTLGDRIYELQLPFARKELIRNKVIEMVSSCIRDRIEARANWQEPRPRPWLHCLTTRPLS